MLKHFLSFPLLILISASCLAQNIVQLTDATSRVTFPIEVSADGSKVFYFNAPESSPDRVGSIFVRDINRPTPELVVEVARVRWMKSSRDGSRLIYAERNAIPTVGSAMFLDLYSVDVASKRVAFLATLPFFSRIVDLADAARTVFVQTTGTTWPGGAWQPGAIWSIPWEGGPVTRVSSFGSASTLVADQDGKVLYLTGPCGYYRLDTQSGDAVALPYPPVPPCSLGTTFFSSDRKTAIFSASSGGSSVKIHRHRIDTGEMQLLIDHPNVTLAAVSPDTKSLLVEAAANWTGENPDLSRELFLVSGDGTGRRQLTNNDQFSTSLYDGYTNPSAFLSADGTHVVLKALWGLPSGRQQSSIYKLTLATSVFEVLDATTSQEFSLLRLLDDNHLAVLSSGTAPERDLIVMKSDGSRYRRLSYPTSAGSVVGVSVDGQKLVLSRSFYATDGGITRELSLYRTATGELTKIFELKDPACQICIIPYFGPIFVSMDDAGDFITFNWYDKFYLIDLRKNSPEVKFLPRPVAGISGDGRWLVQTEYDPINPRLFLVRTDGSETRALGTGSGGKLSSDGEWIVFFRRSEIFVAKTDGSFEQRIPPSQSPDWKQQRVDISGDGKTVIAFETQSGTSAVVAYGRLGTEVGRIDLPSNYYLNDMKIDSTGGNLYFTSDTRSFGRNVDGARQLFLATFKPFQNWVPAANSNNQVFTGIALTNLDQNDLMPSIGAFVGVPFDDPKSLVTLAARNDAGDLLAGPGIQNPVSKRIQLGEQKAWLLTDLFGAGILDKKPNVEIVGSGKLTTYFLTGSSSLDRLEGLSPSRQFQRDWRFQFSARIFGASALILTNPNDHGISVHLGFYSSSTPFSLLTPFGYAIASRGSLTIDVSRGLLPAYALSTPVVLQVSSWAPLRAELRATRGAGQNKSTVSVPPLEPLLGSDSLIFPHILAGGLFQSMVWITNSMGQAAQIEIEFLNSGGQSIGTPQHRTVLANETLELSLDEIFDSDSLVSGYLRARSTTATGRINGFALVSSLSSSNHSSFVVDSARTVRKRVVFPYLAQSDEFFTGYAAVNPFPFPVRIQLTIFNADGYQLKTVAKWLAAQEKQALLLWEIYPADQLGGYFTVTADWPISTMALIGTSSGSLVQLPAQ